MSYQERRQVHDHRGEIAGRWREANQLCIELCLTAQENGDPAVINRIKAAFDAVIAELEESRSAVAWTRAGRES